MQSRQAVTQDDIRKYLARSDAVVIQVARADDGSPEIAWGDTFFYIRDKSGAPKKMPFTTIVTKDYDGFDTDSQLNRGGLYRLNIDVGKEKLEEMFDFKPREPTQLQSKFDCTALNTFFPHPVYGPHGWISIINPDQEQASAVHSLLDFSQQRALRR
jgi:hypothetical protein